MKKTKNLLLGILIINMIFISAALMADKNSLPVFAETNLKSVSDVFTVNSTMTLTENAKTYDIYNLYNNQSVQAFPFLKKTGLGFSSTTENDSIKFNNKFSGALELNYLVYSASMYGGGPWNSASRRGTC
jgi:hypothetical protein